MNGIIQQLNNEDNIQLNNSNFEKEGEYIIEKKPKYKYELRIVHENPNLIEIKRPNTPDRIISSANFSILSDKKGNNYNKQYKIFINKNKFKNKYIQSNTPERGSTIRFYSKNSEKINQMEKNNYYLKNYKYCNCNYFNNNYNNNYNNKCVCQTEFNKLLRQYYGQNIYENKICKCHNYLGRKNDYKNIYKRKIIYIQNPNKREIINYNNNNYNYANKTIDNYYYYNINEDNRNDYNYDYNKRKIIKISNNNNNKDLYKGSSSHKKKKKIKRYKNKKIKIINENAEENNNINNTSFISIDNTRHKNISLYASPSPIIKKQKEKQDINTSIYRLQKDNKSIHLSNLSNILCSSRSNSRRRSNNNILINKSSETKQRLKVVPLGQKIKPLIIKKMVEKPKIEKIINKDGTITDVIKQNSVITSIESKPVINSENEKIVKESVTKIYTTLTKNLDEIDDNNNDKNNININEDIDIEEKNINEKNEEIKINKDCDNNSVFIRRDFKNKEQNEYNLEVIDTFNKEKKQLYKNKNLKNNININNIDNNEINENSTIQKISEYSSIGYNSFNFNENKQNLKNEPINYIKYLYNNNPNELNNYFLKLNEEEKINILNSFNDGNIENKNIYLKLIDILKEKNDNEEEENNIIINNNSFKDNKENINNREEQKDA